MNWGADQACSVNRVLRGGNWNNSPDNARSANRNDNTPENRNDDNGLRPSLCIAMPDARRHAQGQRP